MASRGTAASRRHGRKEWGIQKRKFNYLQLSSGCPSSENSPLQGSEHQPQESGAGSDPAGVVPFSLLPQVLSTIALYTKKLVKGTRFVGNLFP